MKAEKKLKVKLIFTRELLGTASANPDIHKEFIASKAPTPEKTEIEVENIVNPEEQFEKALTVFPRWSKDKTTPILYSYQISGYFKESCGALRKLSRSYSSKIKAYKKEIDKLIHVVVEGAEVGMEDQIPIHYDGEITICQRPLRGSTPQGERIALASSESIPAGAWVEFTILLDNADDENAVIEWLDEGELNGIGQWRNSMRGTFLWELLDDDGNVIGGNPPMSEDDLKELLGSREVRILPSYESV